MANVVELPKQKKKWFKTMVRLSDELREEIKASAENNFRSMAQEIQFRLKRDMDADHG